MVFGCPNVNILSELKICKTKVNVVFSVHIRGHMRMS